LFKAGRVDEALPLLKQATALAPESAALLGNYAKALSLAGRHEEAIAGFTALATRQPDDADVQYDAGVAFLHAGKTAAAAAQFRKVLALKPDHAAARNALHEAETGSPIITAPQKPVSEN
jgi:Flp pilus assembly protein TadD